MKNLVSGNRLAFWAGVFIYAIAGFATPNLFEAGERVGAAIWAVNSGGSASAVSQTTRFDAFSDGSCSSLLGSFSINGPYTFYENTTIRVNSASAYAVLDANGVTASNVQSLRIVPLNSTPADVFSTNNCFAVTCSMGSECTTASGAMPVTLNP